MVLKKINEISDSDFINVTPEWMAQKYDEMNRTLFSGKLGSCKFRIFTTGRGKNGGVLGWFKKDSPELKYKRRNRRLFKYDQFGHEIWVDKDNFVEMCNPTIELNGNYRWTEKAALTTLVHEMCHYYCNKDGFVPAQHHGPEFRRIATIVSAKSNGIFTLQRVASAEQMGEMELDSEIKAAVDRRKENKINRMLPVLSYMITGKIELVNANSVKLVKELVKQNKKTANKIVLINDLEFKKMIFEKGYRAIMTVTGRYWDITRETWINDIGKYNYQVLYEE